MCPSCFLNIPAACTNLTGLSVETLDDTIAATCQVALGLYGRGAGGACFVENTLSQFSGIDLMNCLDDSLPMCSEAETPTSILTTTTTTACGTATATACVTSLPDQCGSLGHGDAGLFDSLFHTIDTTACQTALGVFGVYDAAVCFTSSILSVFTGSDFDSCLTSHVPMCDNCVSVIPSVCTNFTTFGFGGLIDHASAALCQTALGAYGLGSAAYCFIPDVLSSNTGSEVLQCVNNNIQTCTPSADAYSTSYTTGGLTGYTRLATTTVGGLLGIGGSPSTYVIVDVPTHLPTHTTTSGAVSRTTTITTTIGGGLFGHATTSTYVLVDVPTGHRLLS
ncbi:uncharacterized protein BKA78DRAFT_315418 [Phyllosticta capitalensis]|uniref:uncharacterized protein n=1 Tax=Phyllosticta capitalensis TaxID=121624 RepID=UPI0031305BDA